MDADDGSEGQVDAIAQPTSTAPGSPIAVDDPAPASETRESSAQASSSSQSVDDAAPAAVANTAASDPAPIQSEPHVNTDKHEHSHSHSSEARSSEPRERDLDQERSLSHLSHSNSNGVVNNAPEVIEIEQAHIVVDAVGVKPEASPAPSTSAPKPKSRAQKARSPSPPTLPPPPPPALTVRLTIELGGPSNYQTSILELAKETGQRNPTPPPVKRDSDSGGSDDDDEDEQTDAPVQVPTLNGAEPPVLPIKRRKRRKRQDPDEYYDVNDPFIDDSDLGIDAPTHFAQTKQKGFYVNSGDVTLVLDEPEPVVKKARKRRAFVPEMPSFLAGKGKAHTEIRSAGTPQPIPIAMNGFEPGHTAHEQQDRRSSAGSASVPRMVGEGTRDSPIALLDDSESSKADDYQSASKRMKMANGESVGVPGNLHTALSAVKLENGDGSRKRKISSIGVAEVHEFSPELLEEFAKLRQLVSEADFSVKSKFPPQLRAPLAAAAIRAVELEEYGEAFFKYLPDIFPYNKFTMTKLVKRLIYDRHTGILNERMDGMLENLRSVVKAGFPAAEQAYKDDFAKWEEKQERKKTRNPDEDGGTTPGTAFVTANDTNADGGAGKKERGDAPPQQRYKLTDEIKNIIWQLVTVNNELAAMTNTMHEWEPDNHHAVSDQSMRKNLYQRIVGVFPEGWINTGLISREFSNMKRKVQMADVVEQVVSDS